MCFNEQGTQLLITTHEGLKILTQNSKNGKYDIIKELNSNNVQYTITDSDLSSDGKFLVHSTLGPNISIFDIQKEKYLYQCNLVQPNIDDEDNDHYNYFALSSIRIFSVKYNYDASQILASSACIQQGYGLLKLFDVTHNKLQHSIPAHTQDINSIAFVNKKNSSVFISGSDDCDIIAWDTRALGINNKPVGYFLGHVCGITNVQSREDGYYIASNGKDQSLKLWDMRKMEESNNQKQQKKIKFDYRYQKLSKQTIDMIKSFKQEDNFDNSIYSFFGHQVYGTLIRCHFSPMNVNNRRYLYTGSYDGNIYIYDIYNGNKVGMLDNQQIDPIRDCIWHPNDLSIYSGNLQGQFEKWFFNPKQLDQQ